MEKIIDLHMHTTMSDGALTPKEIIDEAVRNGVDTISITDHDTVEAYQEELFEYAKEKNIQLIVGVEISTKTEKCGIHVLGYHFDLHNQQLLETLHRLRDARHIYLNEVASVLEKLGYEVNVEKLNQIDAVTKAHIAADVVDNPKNHPFLQKQYGYIPNKGEFIETVMNEGCPAYVKKMTLTPEEAAELIRNAGGKVVLAHPVAYFYEDGMTEEEVLNLIHSMQADGVETNYLYVDRNDKKHDDTAKWNDFAKKNHLFTTIGSDFHLKDGIRPEVGFANWKLTLPPEQVQNIIFTLLQ